MANKCANAGAVQAVETPHELDLRGKAAIGPVKDVTGYKQRIDTAVDTKRDDTCVGLERGATEDVSNMRLRLSDARERAVQVEIGGMNKAK
jgi:hypothetical protein